MQSNRGYILFPTLVIFMMFLGVVLKISNATLAYNQALLQLSQVEKILEIEKISFEKARLGEANCDFGFSNIDVSCSNEGDKLKISFFSERLYALEYDIIEDGSFKLRLMEE